MPSGGTGVWAPRARWLGILALTLTAILGATCTSPSPDTGGSSTPASMHCDGDEGRIPCCADAIRVYYPLGQVSTDLTEDAASVLHEIAGEGEIRPIPAVPPGQAALFLERDGKAYAVVRYLEIRPGRWVRISSSTCVTMPGREALGPDPLVVTFLATLDRPTAWVRFGDETGEAVVGSYCWHGSDFAGCIDTAPLSPERFSDLLPVPQGTQLIVNGTAKRIDGSIATLDSPYEAVATLDVGDGSARLDVAPGRYVLSFEAIWPEGGVPIFVGIEIEP